MSASAAYSLSGVLEAVPGLVSTWDHELRNRYANTAYAAWFGLTPADLLGRPLAEIAPELHAGNVERFARVLAGETQFLEGPVRGHDGQVHHMQAMLVPDVVDGVQQGVAIIVTDVSARVRAEAALRESFVQIALLKERQRIAADLHDGVIQRLYAAGLDLVSAGRTGTDPRPRIRRAAAGLEEANHALRLAIQSLLEIVDPTTLPSAIDQLVEHASETLQLVPTVTYSGSIEHVPVALGKDVLEALSEALTNVARHARAQRVDVRISTTDGAVRVQVADDGAEQGVEEPAGTVLQWRVPSAEQRRLA